MLAEDVIRRESHVFAKGACMGCGTRAIRERDAITVAAEFSV